MRRHAMMDDVMGRRAFPPEELQGKTCSSPRQNELGQNGDRLACLTNPFKIVVVQQGPRFHGALALTLDYLKQNANSRDSGPGYLDQLPAMATRVMVPLLRLLKGHRRL